MQRESFFRTRGRLGGLALGQFDELMEVAGGLEGGGAGDGDQDDRGGQQEQPQPGWRREQRGDAARHLAGAVQVSTGPVGTGPVAAVPVAAVPVAAVQAGPALPLLGDEAEGGHRGVTAWRRRRGREGGVSDGTGGECPVAGLGRGPLVGPAFNGVAGLGGDRAEQRVGGGGERATDVNR